MVSAFYKFFELINRKTKKRIYVLIDIAIVAFSIYFSISVDFFVTEPNLNLKAHFFLILLICATSLIFQKLGLNKDINRFTSIGSINRIILGVSASSFLLFAIALFETREVNLSSLFIFFFLASVLLATFRLLIRSVFEKQICKNPTIAAIYGAGDTGRQLAGALRQSTSIKISFFIETDKELIGTRISDVPVTDVKNLEKNIKRTNTDTLLIAKSGIFQEQILDFLDNFQHTNLKIKKVPELSRVIDGDYPIEPTPIKVEDLLGRDPVAPVSRLLRRNIKNKNVLVTGAGGSIGSELCRQILELSPTSLVLVDSAELALFEILNELSEKVQNQSINVTILPILGSVCDTVLMEETLLKFKINTIYHAAAYKHVSLVQQNFIEGIKNNVFGTMALSEVATNCKVDSFTLISSDKAVRPANYMGASKRLAELICMDASKKNPSTRFSVVRFGNVLGSSGSVVPIFEKQIKCGGPVTVSSAEVTRYFMTIKEAALLVIQAGGMPKHFDIFTLDMGKPIKILDLAKKMIILAGHKPIFDAPASTESDGIRVVVTSLKNGEKTHEQLSLNDKKQPTEHPRIFKANEPLLLLDDLPTLLAQLKSACDTRNSNLAEEVIKKSPIKFQDQGN